MSSGCTTECSRLEGMQTVNRKLFIIDKILAVTRLETLRNLAGRHKILRTPFNLTIVTFKVHSETVPT